MLNIDKISSSHAVVVLDILDECIWAELSLEHECERMCDDDYTREFFWDQYHPIITDIQGIDDDGEYYPMPVEMAEIIRGCLDCDEFYDGYQACFDDNFKWGKKTERYYYSP
ncbi:hypothetical protein LP092_04985 [Moraxella bovis]|uniref:Uncharacterized protein n=1 Tax=Moraxella bovis TaxID=476 RepID=A0ABY6MBS7_MORBO|nr:hypothetical protein [Moraxella bovis]UZA04096.1 hypothetical protein LP092_04985 [Moraxella bovis]